MGSWWCGRGRSAWRRGRFIPVSTYRSASRYRGGPGAGRRGRSLGRTDNREPPHILTQGEAREYLIATRKDHPELDLRKIVDVTELRPVDPNCAVFMYSADGMIKTSREEIHKFLETKCWKKRTL